MSKTIASPLRLSALLACTLAAAGCGLLGGGNKESATIFVPDPRVSPDPSWPKVDWQLAVSRPEAARMVDTLRIAVRPVPGEVRVYKGANWAKTPSEQVEDALLRALEDSGRIAAVARQGSGIAANYKLVMDLRRYDADYAGGATPAAVIEINAKLLHTPGQEVVGSRTFLQSTPAASTDITAVAQAFSQSLGAMTRDLAGWTLATGEARERQAPSKP